MKHLTTLAVIAQNLAPLLNPSRDEINQVRFEGTDKHLTAWATDGHVMARVVVVGKFAAPNATLKVWVPGSSILQAADLGPDALVVRPTRKPLVATANMEQLFPASTASRGGPGAFMGPALRAMAEVIERFGAQVQFAVDANPKKPMRVDSYPFLLTTLDEPRAWLSLVVMPSSRTGVAA